MFGLNMSTSSNGAGALSSWGGTDDPDFDVDVDMDMSLDLVTDVGEGEVDEDVSTPFFSLLTQSLTTK